MAIALVWSCSKDNDTPNTPAPSILTFAPSQGTVGTTITIVGKNFSAIKAENTVTIGTAITTVTNASANELSVLVPDGATSGKLSVTIGGQKATSGTFTVTETEPVNQAPVFGEGSLAFEQPENISDADVIGIVTAKDPDGNGENLIFEITTNTENNLFIISEFGEISLKAGMNLDYESATNYIIEVTVSDGEDSTTAEVTISILNVIEPGELATNTDSFITTWTIPEGGFWLLIPTDEFYEFNYTIDWGDGTLETNITTPNPLHHYEIGGVYKVAIQGNFPSIKMSGSPNQATSDALTSIDQWGNIVWQGLDGAFDSCANMIYNALDTPNLEKVTSLYAMFSAATSFNGDIGDWDVSTIHNMSYMFADATNFDGNVGEWAEKTANVSNMNGMFGGTSNFNQDLSSWVTSSVESMNFMFSQATNFNQDLGSWDISSVTDMFGMFDISGMSPTNFANTVIDWSNKEVQQGVYLGAVGIIACSSDQFEAATFELISNNQWDISYNGVEVCN
ncbi:hypothetical protein Musp01_21450 [Muricauda sp. NBRC 101325]|nr:hypothetical protein Musp01_21450 [Muricauda sp. NBRC 101325]